MNNSSNILICEIGKGANTLEAIMTLQKIVQEQATIRTLLSDQAEFSRLCELVNAKHNTYSSQHEVNMLRELAYILSAGVNSTNIKSVQDIVILGGLKRRFVY